MAFLDRFFVHCVVQEVEPLAPRVRRIRLGGPALQRLSYTPGQQLRVVVGDVLSMDLLRNDAVRTYSVWDHAPAEGHLDLCVLDHPNGGPGARFGRTAQPGQPVRFSGPEGKLVLRRAAPLHLFIGDETGAVAFGAMLRALPPGAAALCVVAVDGPEDQLPLHAGPEVRWIYRRGRSSADPEVLLDALKEIDLPATRGRTAYLAGEGRTCKALRRHLVDERGWARGDVLLKPFWTPGAKGLE